VCEIHVQANMGSTESYEREFVRLLKSVTFMDLTVGRLKSVKTPATHYRLHLSRLYLQDP
jgi:hypothetical protein